MLDSMRTRLTLWYVGVLALVLITFSCGVYALLARNLYNRMDAELRSAARATAVLIVNERAEGEADEEAVRTALAELFLPDQAIAVFDERGQLVAEKTSVGNLHARIPASRAAPFDSVQLLTVPEEKGDHADGQRLAAERLRISTPGPSYLLVVSQSFQKVNEELKFLRGIFYVAVLLALALAGLGGWFLARQSLAPVVAMSERARRIGAENLDQKLPVTNPRDELGRLATTFNELLARLGAAFALQREFMSDASHELRTPLHVIRTAAEVTLERDQRSENEYRDALATIDEQSRRLAHIVEDMFTLAQADAGHRTLQTTDFYLDELLVETVRAARVLADRKGVVVEVAKSPEAPYSGDESLLRQMIMNLLSNAIKYTPPGGLVRVDMEPSETEYTIKVEDTGIGIPPEAQPHIFQRFYRADGARTRGEDTHGSGAGLGLAIARWIAEAHHGRLELYHSGKTGSIFVAALPRA